MVDLQSSLVFHEHEIVSSYEHLFYSFMFINLKVLFLSFSLFFKLFLLGFPGSWLPHESKKKGSFRNTELRKKQPTPYLRLDRDEFLTPGFAFVFRESIRTR